MNGFSSTTRDFLSNPEFVEGLRSLLSDAASSAQHSYDLIRIPLEATGLVFSEAHAQLVPAVGRKVATMILTGRRPGMLDGIQASMRPSFPDKSKPPKPPKGGTTARGGKLEKSVQQDEKALEPELESLSESLYIDTLSFSSSSSKKNNIYISASSGKNGGGERLKIQREFPVEFKRELAAKAEEAGVVVEKALQSVVEYHNSPTWILEQLDKLIVLKSVAPVESPTGVFVNATKGLRTINIPTPRVPVAAKPRKEVFYAPEAKALVGQSLEHRGQVMQVVGLRDGRYAVLIEEGNPGIETLVTLSSLLGGREGGSRAEMVREAPQVSGELSLGLSGIVGQLEGKARSFVEGFLAKKGGGSLSLA